MSDFFFDIAEDGTSVITDASFQYPTRDAACRAAISTSQSIMRDLMSDPTGHREVSIKVRDNETCFFEARMAFNAEWVTDAVR